MSTLVGMPTHLRECIDFALHPFGISPKDGSGHPLEYDLEFEGGLTLTVAIMCVQRPWLIIFKHPPEVQISVVQPHGSRRKPTHHLTRLMPMPTSASDIVFCQAMQARFASMTRAVADTLGAGECITLGG